MTVITPSLLSGDVYLVRNVSRSSARSNESGDNNENSTGAAHVWFLEYGAVL
jgi:hypothetical protein